jgi:uncharacterized protein with FMN-binding domain
MLQTYEKNSQRKLVATLLTIVVIAGAVLFADQLKTKSSTTVSAVSPSSSATITTTAASNTPAVTPTAASSSTSASTPATSSSGYKDGTYTSTSGYYVPHSSESIDVTLTISNGVITNASIQNSEGDNVSARYQEDFAASYKSHVVGKSISGLKLSIVSGASDTTLGFNDALSQIASEAKV